MAERISIGGTDIWEGGGKEMNFPSSGAGSSRGGAGIPRN